MRLEDAVSVVTGANRGIGKAIADAFVSEGAHVVCSARTESRLLKAVSDISDGPGTAIPVRADLQEWDSIRHLVETTEDVYGGIDLLVNNAGVHPRSLNDGVEYSIAETDVETLDTVLSTNTRGTFLMTKAALPAMQGEGRVIHIASNHGLAGRPNRSPYVITKFGLEGLHQCLALELAEQGSAIESVSIGPPRGGVVSGMTDHRPEEELEDVAPPSIQAEPTVQLAAGGGENGGRYRGTPDGEGFNVIYAFEDFANP